MTPPDTVAQALDALAKASEDDVARLLLRAFRAVSAAVLAQVDPSGAAGVKGSHVAIFASLDPEGTRMVDLAQRSGITRQAASQLVHELADLGMVELRQDALDKRATVVTLTDVGAQFCRKAAEQMVASQQEWAHQTDDPHLAELRRGLHRLLAAAQHRDDS